MALGEDVAYLAAFVNDDGTMKDDYHGAYVITLQFAIPQGELWDKVFTPLVNKLKGEGMQTGFFPTQHLLPLLTDHGQAELDYDLLLQLEAELHRPGRHTEMAGPGEYHFAIEN